MRTSVRIAISAAVLVAANAIILAEAPTTGGPVGWKASGKGGAVAAGGGKAVLAGLEAATEEDLLGARTDSQWYRDWSRTSADAYIRATMHTMAHVRQIWMLRGAMGLTDEQGWPLQHWA